jgi:RimJ/RimL family protein N-acetyltransferase
MFRPTLPIETPRLRLRPYEPGDVGAVLDLNGREDVVRYLNWPAMDRDAAQALVDRRVGQTRIEREGDGIALAATLKADGRFVGELVLRLTSESSRQGEVGWLIHPDVQGRGLATEGAREMLRLGFAEMRLHRIVAECDPRNGASIRVMEHLGMRREAHFRESTFLKGDWVGSMVYAILATEWREARG